MKKNSGISKVVVALLIVVIILAGVAAYGWLRPLPQQAEAVTLEEKARLEGKLTIYGVMDTPDFISKVVPAFEAQYPWASGMIEYVGFSPSELTSRCMAEYQAGNVQADVLFNTLGSFMPALLGGVAENWICPMISLMNYTEGTYAADGLWGPGYQLPIVIIYNSEMVEDLGYDPPDSWDDLADPKWRGLIALDDPKGLNVGGSLFAHLYPIMGETAWMQLMEGIAANEPHLVPSCGEAFTLVASGQCAIGTGLINDYLAGKAQGVPVEIAWIEPVTSLPIVTALAKNAPHPNFAKLFYTWWISAAGQYAIANTGRIPMHMPIATGTILKGVVPPEVTQIEAVAFNNPHYYTNPTTWSDRYRGIFG
ncbi:MAG: extracellular solute-binding protein [Candidatus Bathyarchaeia archaeon]